MSGIEYGLAATSVILALVMIRLWTNQAMRAGTQAQSYAELLRENVALKAAGEALRTQAREAERLNLDLRRENATLKGASEAMAEQNASLRNRVQMMETNRMGLEVTVARLQGELGRAS